MEIEEPENWELEEKGKNGLKWKHKSNNATVWLTKRTFSGWVVTIYDYRKGSNTYDEVVYNKSQKETAYLAAIDYMVKHP